MGIGQYLSESSEKSSLRLNMLIATVSFMPVILAIAFYIVWQTIHGTDPSWSALTLFVTSCAAYFGAIWYGKLINKKAEVKPAEDAASEK